MATAPPPLATHNATNSPLLCIALVVGSSRGHHVVAHTPAAPRAPGAGSYDPSPRPADMAAAASNLREIAYRHLGTAPLYGRVPLALTRESLATPIAALVTDAPHRVPPVQTAHVGGGNSNATGSGSGSGSGSGTTGQQRRSVPHVNVGGPDLARSVGAATASPRTALGSSTLVSLTPPIQGQGGSSRGGGDGGADPLLSPPSGSAAASVTGSDTPPVAPAGPIPATTSLPSRPSSASSHLGMSPSTTAASTRPTTAGGPSTSNTSASATAAAAAAAAAAAGPSTLLGFEPHVLADLLAPKPACCDTPFELQMGDLLFLGLPVALTGAKLAPSCGSMPGLSPYYRKRLARYLDAASAAAAASTSSRSSANGPRRFDDGGGAGSGSDSEPGGTTFVGRFHHQQQQQQQQRQERRRRRRRQFHGDEEAQITDDSDGTGLSSSDPDETTTDEDDDDDDDGDSYEDDEDEDENDTSESEPEPRQGTAAPPLAQSLAGSLSTPVPATTDNAASTSSRRTSAPLTIRSPTDPLIPLIGTAASRHKSHPGRSRLSTTPLAISSGSEPMSYPEHAAAVAAAAATAKATPPTIVQPINRHRHPSTSTTTSTNPQIPQRGHRDRRRRRQQKQQHQHQRHASYADSDTWRQQQGTKDGDLGGGGGESSSGTMGSIPGLSGGGDPNGSSLHINMMHLVFVIADHGPGTRAWADALYNHVALPLTWALRHEQLRQEYVSRQAELVLAARERLVVGRGGSGGGSGIGRGTPGMLFNFFFFFSFDACHSFQNEQKSDTPRTAAPLIQKHTGPDHRNSPLLFLRPQHPHRHPHRREPAPQLRCTPTLWRHCW
ncbi:hypothetical protein BC828DRAFT_277470 [Blastocladiella britannica]|nr:hypothetical protein BC828DRAFT_277470 [Blastocladiella britannica]